MKTIKYKTLNQIKRDLNKGIQIYWANKSYKVHYVDNKKIRITCISNYFGSLLQESEISVCFKEVQ